MPTFSIVMPIYGVENYIHKSIQSILNQTIQDYELILVDDESPDKCPQICDEYAKKYSQIHVIHQKNKGLSGARNTGVKAAKGKYVLFPDSDDTIQPDTLEYFYNILQQIPNAVYIFSDFQYVKLGEEFKSAKYDNGFELLSREKIQEFFLKRKTKILVTISLIEIQWYKDNNLSFENNPYGEDQLFIWKALLHVQNVIHIKKPLYNYLQRPGSIMSASSIKKIEKAYPFFKELDKICKNSPNAIPLIKKFLLPFWVRGILHSSAKILSFKDYLHILTVFEANKYLKELWHYPSFTIRILSLIYFLNKKIFYLINKAI